MPTIEAAIDDFLAQKRIAVAGVSREPGGKHGGNIVYQRFKERGYEVFAVNPNADTVEGDPCYRSLAAIPGGVDAVVIATAAVGRPVGRRGVPAARDHPRLDAPLVRRRERLEGGARALPPIGDRLDRRRLPADVRPDVRRRPSLHAHVPEAVRAAAEGSVTDRRPMDDVAPDGSPVAFYRRLPAHRRAGADRRDGRGRVVRPRPRLRSGSHRRPARGPRASRRRRRRRAGDDRGAPAGRRGGGGRRGHGAPRQDVRGSRPGQPPRERSRARPRLRGDGRRPPRGRRPRRRRDVTRPAGTRPAPSGAFRSSATPGSSSCGRRSTAASSRPRSATASTGAPGSSRSAPGCSTSRRSAPSSSVRGWRSSAGSNGPAGSSPGGSSRPAAPSWSPEARDDLPRARPTPLQRAVVSPRPGARRPAGGRPGGRPAGPDRREPASRSGSSSSTPPAARPSSAGSTTASGSSRRPSSSASAPSAGRPGAGRCTTGGATPTSTRRSSWTTSSWPRPTSASGPAGSRPSTRPRRARSSASPPEGEPMLFTPLGFPATDASPSARHPERKPLEELVRYERWGGR